MLVKKALYGLKSSGATFRALLSETLLGMCYTPTRADPDVYLWAAVKPDGFEYYKMVLCYVDDILVISHTPHAMTDELKLTFKLKDDKVACADVYLGA
jgi:hypothetical protein